MNPDQRATMGGDLPVRYITEARMMLSCIPTLSLEHAYVWQLVYKHLCEVFALLYLELVRMGAGF